MQEKRRSRLPALFRHQQASRQTYIQPSHFGRFEVEVTTTSNFLKRDGHLAGNSTLAAMDRMERYCTANPGSPSAARRPQLLYRGQLWIALLGPNVQEGIIGIGKTVESALRAFDAQYLAGLRPPSERFRRSVYHFKAAPPASIRT